MKECKICGVPKPAEAYYRLRGKNYKDEWNCRDSYCKDCRANLTHIRRTAIKQQAVEYKGGKCVDCGLESTQYCIYDFHHIAAGKDFSVAKLKHKSLDWLKSELDKCVLVCANCHRIRHAKATV